MMKKYTGSIVIFTLALAFLVFGIVPQVQATYPKVDECQGECLTYETKTYCSKYFLFWCTKWSERQVCTEYENTCTEPEVTPTVTPTQTPEPTTVPTRLTSDTSNPHIECVAKTPEKLPREGHVIRNGSEATVKAFIPEGDKVNVYFKENSSNTWDHAERDVQVIDDGQRRVEVTIYALNPALGYTFGVQAVNACNGGEIVAVIVDPPAYGEVFTFSYWEVL